MNSFRSPLVAPRRSCSTTSKPFSFCRNFSTACESSNFVLFSGTVSLPLGKQQLRERRSFLYNPAEITDEIFGHRRKLDECIAELQAQLGAWFDPQAVTDFLRNHNLSLRGHSNRRFHTRSSFTLLLVRSIAYLEKYVKLFLGFPGYKVSNFAPALTAGRDPEPSWIPIRWREERWRLDILGGS